MADVVVVGAGVFGAWTAHHLRAAGARVSLVDAYGAAHPRASSGDHSRILRCGYGADEIYARMAWRSRQQWLDLERRLERRIWHPCGVLWLAAAGDSYAAATRATLERCALPFEVLDRQRLHERVPHLYADDLPDVMLEPECGALSARRAVRLLATELSKDGVTILHGRVEAPAPGRLVAVQLHDGSRVTGERFVFACGAWLPTIFPDVLAGRIRPTRQTVVYFGTPSGSDLFTPAHTPAWVDFPAGIYGVPDVDDRGLKVGIDEHGPPIDPDSDDRIADSASIARARGWLSHRFPTMREAPVIEARVCQYENTTNGDFLIDRHPNHDNVWIVGGGSGHGFKHGPAVGEYAAKMVLTGEAPEPRFTLTAKTSDARRAVY
jgi:monomeric sarcosine oxidase